MHADLLANLETIEKEKNISREFMLETLKTGLISALRKLFPDNESYDIEIDPLTIEIKVLKDGKPFHNAEFSRIAAQTAKQVIFQKLREAEKEAIYKQYSAKVGEILSGEIHRIDGRNVIVMLGELEALLPRREQVYKELYRQGDHIKAYVIEVRKSMRGPDVILSRTHRNFVRRLFEMEVPEISEGIVEIKGIAREGGQRTKIAVYSKDDKVDCVGSCVGMRGQRVKTIVDELDGEKIDIVRWNEVMETYIRNALSPAKISGITFMEKQGRAEVLVEDDQLSLAIGKKGQNVRLGSRLTGWELDIRTSAQKIPLKDLEGVGAKTEKILRAAGITTVKDLLKKSADDLKGLEGIGPKTAERIIEAAHKIFLQAKPKTIDAKKVEALGELKAAPEGSRRKGEISAAIEKAFTKETEGVEKPEEEKTEEPKKKVKKKAKGEKKVKKKKEKKVKKEEGKEEPSAEEAPQEEEKPEKPENQQNQEETPAEDKEEAENPSEDKE